MAGNSAKTFGNTRETCHLQSHEETDHFICYATALLAMAVFPADAAPEG